MTAAVVAVMLALNVLPQMREGARANELPPGPVYVHFHACPTPGQGGIGTDLDFLRRNCDDDAWYVNFSLTTEGVRYNGQWISGDPRDQVFNNVPAHIFSLEGQISPYDGEPVVYCQGGDGGQSGEYVRMQVHVGDGYTVQPKLGPIGYVVCDWFAAASNLNDDATASVAIDLRVCPLGFDLAGADHNALPAACDVTQNGVTFRVESYLNYPQNQETGGLVDSGIYWQHLNPDFVQITAPASGDRAHRVFCRGELPGTQYPTQEFPASGGTFAYNLLDGEQLICDWYMSAVGGTVTIDIDPGNQLAVDEQGPDGAETNDTESKIESNDASDEAVAPEGGEGEQSGDAEVVDQDEADMDESDAAEADETTGGGDVTEESTSWPAPVPGTGAVLINVHVCPVGFGASSATVDDLAANCGGDGNGFAFTLTTEGQVFPQTSGAMGDAQLFWNNVPAHIFTIEEALPGGYESPIVMCDGQRLEVSGTAVHPAVTDGATLTCDWYNQQA